MSHADARPRYCPACGGPNPEVSTTACTFCGAPVVPLGTPDPRHSIRCPSCATSVSEGSSYCGDCGGALADCAPTPSGLSCPGCGESPMQAFALSPTVARPGGTTVHGCPRCGGVWVSKFPLERLVATAAESTSSPQAAAGPARVHRRRMANTKVVYRKCAECGQHMLRRNFARISGVVVDRCADHGTYFDAGELEDVLAFVRSGGLAMAQERDAQESAWESRQRSAISTSASSGISGWSVDADPGLDPITGFLRWAARWVTGRR